MLTAMGVAALVSPLWGAFAIITGRLLLKENRHARWMAATAGIIIIAVNLIYLISSLSYDPAMTEGNASWWLFFYLARIMFGAYILASGLKKTDNSPFAVV
ncbi:MAG: hypothetical protein A2Z34_04775 [Planctomycetes bacterium RBG_16_59_8]|nr:MAG: hypothetical protein A2Z34_04775 [Planctomycetes bacterium RBG_16_59_8]